MSNAYTEVTKDQNNAVNRGVAPDHKVDGFNSQAAPVRPPQAAIFDEGASSLPEIQGCLRSKARAFRCPQ